MLKKQSNQLVALTNISESLNIQRDTRQHSEQTEASVPLNTPLGSTHVTTTVSNTAVCYSTTVFGVLLIQDIPSSFCSERMCKTFNLRSYVVQDSLLYKRVLRIQA